MVRPRQRARRSPLPLLAVGVWLAGCDGQPTEPAGDPIPGDPQMSILGEGRATVTDEEGSEFTAAFRIDGAIDAGGVASGAVNFAFAPEFADVWGAVPGVVSIHVWGRITRLGGIAASPVGSAAVPTAVPAGAALPPAAGDCRRG